ncbi:MAG TPA: DUF1329 domain-containing protein [Candidatus Binatia bacterium]|jgi:hypothetical protein|nr:DUF1329 domain-containing protein [Candidatus Binatia bacterium]
MQKQFCSVLIGLVCLTSLRVHAEVSSDVIQQMFYPYANGLPSVAGLAPGTMISKDSWEAAKDYLPAEILEAIKAGEFAFTVQETTNLPVSEAYIEATKQHAERVRIGADGELEGYTAGLPFPVLDLADPQAGLKAAWNLRYRDFGDIMQVWNTFRLVPESGPPEREIENYYVVAYGMHRPQTDGTNPNKWEKDGVLYKEFYHILAPFDLKNSMSLKLRYDRDRHNDDNWMYSPASRKVRKLIVKQDEASYDSGFLNEDFMGYWGYVRSCHWQLLGTRRLLVPAGVKAASATFGGRGNWYPVDPWELRDMLVLQCTPTAKGHLYSKRVLYIDQQMFTPVYVLFYDQEGKHQKTLFELYGNPQFNPGNEHVRVPLWVGESMVDYENSLGSMTVVSKAVYNVPLPDDFFNLDRIMARGQ